MKTIVLLIATILPTLLYGQEAARQALKREIDAYTRQVYSDAQRFLNKELSAAERIKAVEPHSVIYDERQVEQFKAVVLDEREPAEVRAMALDKIAHHLPNDEWLVRLHTEWLGNPQTPRVLREAALKVEASLSFSHMNTPEVYQRMLDAPELAYRVFAFTKLVIHGDARAQQRLIEGLQNPEKAQLPTPLAISILTMAPKKEYYPALYQVLQQTRDPSTRLETIRALGPYMPARQQLIAISRDPAENVEFREAALAALYGSDRDNIVQYATPILSDPGAPPRLQGIALQMSIDVRQSSAYRTRAKRADTYDRLVQRLAREAADADVRRIASQYVEAVKPKY
jgi:hypothetical protein